LKNEARVLNTTQMAARPLDTVNGPDDLQKLSSEFTFDLNSALWSP
jgi:hypothetical protein